MNRYFFSGVVLPERAQLSVGDVGFEMKSQDGTEVTTVRLNIFNNQLSVQVDTDETDIYTVRNLVKAEAEVLTNLAGFLMGYGYDVEVTKVHGEDLAGTTVFGIAIPVLEHRAQRRDFSLSVNALFQLCWVDLGIYLRRALVDLNLSLRRLEDTPFYLFRAIESLRHSFGDELKIASEAEQWKAMAAAIGGSKEEMDPIRVHALPLRHGKPGRLSGPERAKLFLLAWDIVERYVDYRLAQAGSPVRVRVATESARDG